jgi:K(+)-stimulated pyrophosphate-energized sodium pump
VFWAIILGLVVGTLMSMVTEYYTSMGRRPVDSIVQKSGTGHGTNVIGGLAMGMESTVFPDPDPRCGYLGFVHAWRACTVWRSPQPA